MSDELVEIGTVPLELVTHLNVMRNRVSELLIEAGRIEIRRQDLLNEVRRLETQAQDLVAEERKRLGLPEGAAWQITPEGKALVPASANA